MNAVLNSAISIFVLCSALAMDIPRHFADLGVLIGDGWHPWYEVKVDPENSRNLIICGTKWDAPLNAALGFVYASSNGGTTWQPVLEDRNSTWVTEQSCAFGPNHRAYFISEASEVTEGELNHHLGKTRLYLSSDGGLHWTEAATTGWADFSTSAVSSVSHKLYTFFNATRDDQRKLNDVGLIVFSADGKKVTGPFFSSGNNDYLGAYPSNAVGVKSGAVVALYYGVRSARSGREVELGVVIADPSEAPSMQHVPISRASVGGNCINAEQGSLAYDSESNELLVAYVDGCQNSRIIVKASVDEGRTWTETRDISDFANPGQLIAPSIAVCPSGRLGIIGEEGWRSGQWVFSSFQDHKLNAPLTLSSKRSTSGIDNHSLWTTIEQANDRDSPLETSIAVNVRSDPAGIWRANGLACAGDNFLAVWPSPGAREGLGLYSRIFPVGRLKTSEQQLWPRVPTPEVTPEVAILYGGMQQYDAEKNILKLCLSLRNHGTKPILAPIMVEAVDVRSPDGNVSVLGSTNGLSGAGAVFDISSSVTGNQIPPNAASNPFCLSFHLEIPNAGISSSIGDDFLNLKFRVLTNREPVKQARTQSKTEKESPR